MFKHLWLFLQDKNITIRTGFAVGLVFSILPVTIDMLSELVMSPLVGIMKFFSPAIVYSYISGLIWDKIPINITPVIPILYCVSIFKHINDSIFLRRKIDKRNKRRERNELRNRYHDDILKYITEINKDKYRINSCKFGDYYITVTNNEQWFSVLLEHHEVKIIGTCLKESIIISEYKHIEYQHIYDLFTKIENSH